MEMTQEGWGRDRLEVVPTRYIPDYRSITAATEPLGYLMENLFYEYLT